MQTTDPARFLVKSLAQQSMIHLTKGQRGNTEALDSSAIPKG
jgi:hypothetical protein